MRILKKLGVLVLLVSVVACAGTNQDKSKKSNNLADVNTVFFGFNQADIAKEEAEKLDTQVSWLMANKAASITIEGHTDHLGTSEYNLALGERRAVAIKNYLASKGIAADRIKTVSYGKDQPANTDTTDSARSENRRTITIEE